MQTLTIYWYLCEPVLNDIPEGYNVLEDQEVGQDVGVEVGLQLQLGDMLQQLRDQGYALLPESPDF